MAVSIFSGMPPASSIFTLYASISALLLMLQTILSQLVPGQVQDYILNKIHLYFMPKSCNINATIVIEERDGMSMNEIYSAAEIYLCTKTRPNIERVKISKRHKDTNVSIKFAQSEKIADSFQGMELLWRFVNEEMKKTSKVIDEETDILLLESERRYFELCFDKKYTDKVLDSYVPFVLEKANSIRAENNVVKLHTLACAASYTSSNVWDSINLQHPSTFDTIAMDCGQKQALMDDLGRFLSRREFYRKVGRAWKRGYLLYGPPGTGKSSLIAAIANHLKFDVYDLELTNIKRNSDLRKILLRTANRSILVIEDIDCSTDQLLDRNGPTCANGPGQYRPDQQFTLSGLLNFVDGLWSSCGDERIIIFTTNNRDKLDPALLRPGRMDMHIHMSYLTLDGFKLLASTYLGIHDHGQYSSCFGEIEDLIQNMRVTPAEVAEELMRDDDAQSALQGLIHFLKSKRVSSSHPHLADPESDMEVNCNQ
ncbi:AAA-ATPase At3g50940-like [Henckelia pumila]|uniref:AAA-ATPase At3g50940-like n=1 Tax=Henckelia pumila TaxID=405737 RepID=UPI003C6E2DC8